MLIRPLVTEVTASAGDDLKNASERA